MRCPRCRNIVENNSNVCEVCGHQLNSKNRKINLRSILKILLIVFLVYYGYQFIKSGNVLMFIFTLGIIVVTLPCFNKKLHFLKNLNLYIKIITLIFLVLIVGITGGEAKKKNSIFAFIHEYELKDEFDQMCIDDIKSIKINRKYEHPDYPSIYFKLINMKNKEYDGLISGHSDGTYNLVFFREKNAEEIVRDYYVSKSSYDENNKINFNLYDYKTDKLLENGNVIVENQEPKIIIDIRAGEDNQYAVNMPFEYSYVNFYKIPSGHVYRVTRKAISDSPDSTSFIWLDYDDKIADGNYVEYKNYEKYEFENDDSEVLIEIKDNLYLDLTGDYYYTFESVK